MNEREQLELENYLREFQPRMPRALPATNPAQTWRRLAAAVALFFLCAASIRSVYQGQGPKRAGLTTSTKEVKPRPSSRLLTKLALENPARLEAALYSETSNTLQRFDGPESALRVLSKE